LIVNVKKIIGYIHRIIHFVFAVSNAKHFHLTQIEFNNIKLSSKSYSLFPSYFNHQILKRLTCPTFTLINLTSWMESKTSDVLISLAEKNGILPRLQNYFYHTWIQNNLNSYNSIINTFQTVSFKFTFQLCASFKS